MMGSLVKECLAVSFDALEDPRVDRGKKYPLQEIVFLAIFAALRGIECWRGIELLRNERLDFLRRLYLFKEGIPSHQTIGRDFSILKPKSFEAFFMAWFAALSGPSAGQQIAIALYGIYDRYRAFVTELLSQSSSYQFTPKKSSRVAPRRPFKNC